MSKYHYCKTKHPSYGSWANMRQRCLDPNYPGYYRYGGRGIGIDPTWSNFWTFVADMGECPPGYSLDRIDNNGGYFKENCRWTYELEQHNPLRNGLRSNSRSGIRGVCWNVRPSEWRASARIGNVKQVWLYRGRDFFEACCARKSWEAEKARIDSGSSTYRGRVGELVVSGAGEGSS